MITAGTQFVADRIAVGSGIFKTANLEQMGYNIVDRIFYKVRHIVQVGNDRLH